MEQATSEYREKTFTCQSCDLSSPFTYYGQKPPNTRAIVLLEECFVTQDPFSPDKEKFLVLGSTCSLCSRCVCVGSDCSLFYTKRFCMQCVNKHLQQFPPQIQSELSKKKQNSNLFYTKRFCMQCVNKHLQQFPPQTQSELSKKKQNSKSAIS